MVESRSPNGAAGVLVKKVMAPNKNLYFFTTLQLNLFSLFLLGKNRNALCGALCVQGMQCRP
mgnify:FL=1